MRLSPSNRCAGDGEKDCLWEGLWVASRLAVAERRACSRGQFRWSTAQECTVDGRTDED